MRSRNIVQIGGILFLIGFGLIIISWHNSYPVHLSSINDLTFSQFYVSCWPGLALSLIGLFLVGFYCKNKIVVAVCSSLFPLILYISPLFFSYLSSSDSGAVRAMFQVFKNTGINSQVIPYFEFPNYFSLNEIINRIVGINDKGIAILSFILYGVLLGLFLYLIFVSLKRLNYGRPIPFLFVIIYFVGMYSFLNYQWVPQTLALVYFFILVFISFYLLSDSQKIKWNFIAILFFIPLTLTHAFIPIIFLSFFCILTFKKRYLLQIFLTILSIYLIVTIFYMTTFLHIYILTFQQSIIGFGKEYVNAISISLREPEDILSQIISFSNRLNIPMIWILSIFGTILLFFKKKIDFILIALGLAGGIYLFIGIFYSILGLRAAQILFIPLTIGFMFFISKWKKPTIALVIVILILAVFGPMRMAYNNTQFQTDGEAYACDFLADETITNNINLKVAIGQVNWGYFTNKYVYLKNTQSINFAIRPGNSGFSNVFNDSTNQNNFILYNSNMGKEILQRVTTKERLIDMLDKSILNNKIYDCGKTYILKGTGL